MSRTPIVFLATALAATLWATLAPGSAIQPGELLPAHAALRDSCSACHDPGHGVESARCRTCHTSREIAGRRPELGPLHQELAALECSTCHAEHAGRLGRAPAARFRHALLPAARRDECALCHARRTPADELHAGLSADAERASGRCHTSEAWTPASFEHARFFRFDEHHPARCADCHPAGQGFRSYSCASCHPASAIAHEHDEVAARELSNCVECHRSGSKHEGERRERGFESRKGEHEDEHEDH